MRCWRAERQGAAATDRRLVVLVSAAVLLQGVASLVLMAAPGLGALGPLRADSVINVLRVEAAIGEARGGDGGFLRAELPPPIKLTAALGAALPRALSVAQAAQVATVLGNALCYGLLLLVLGRLAGRLFGPRAGLIAALWAALTPTLLLHFTQPLREPLYLLLELLFLSALARLCAADAKGPVRLALVALVTLLLLWRVRAEAAPLLLLCAAAAALVLARRAWRGGPGMVSGAANLAALLLLCGPLLWSLLPDDICRYEAGAAGRPLAAGSWRPPRCPAHSLLGSADRVRWLRSKFLWKYPGARSNVDVVHLGSPRAALAYAPRAVAVAALAPFPWQWPTLRPWALRGLVVAEMLGLYLAEGLVLWGLWRGRYRGGGARLLLLFAAASLLALGLSVANEGALYRLRYGTWLVCIVLAVGTLPRTAVGVGSRMRARGEHPGHY